MIIVLLIIIDQITKFFAYSKQPDFDIFGDFLRIQYIKNTGTIFGLFENSNYIFLILAAILCIIIAIYMKKKITRESMEEKLFMLILAGGIGNIIDRIFRGFVIDFISLKWVGIFNFSDMYVVIGVTLIIIKEIREIILNSDIDRKND